MEKAKKLKLPRLLLLWLLMLLLFDFCHEPPRQVSHNQPRILKRLQLGRDEHVSNRWAGRAGNGANFSKSRRRVRALEKRHDEEIRRLDVGGPA
jgi:hypothetical protein